MPGGWPSPHPRRNRAGAGLGGPLCLAMLAEAHVEAGQPDAGLDLLDGGLGLLGPYEDRFFDAEVLRVKGELRMACFRPDLEEAEACFTQALELSRRQGARALQLRCATSLARLRSRSGDAERAQELLARIYAGFREGFDTPDLRDAAALLGERS